MSTYKDRDVFPGGFANAEVYLPEAGRRYLGLYLIPGRYAVCYGVYE